MIQDRAIVTGNANRNSYANDPNWDSKIIRLFDAISETVRDRDQGRRHGFESGGTILRAERAKKIFLTPPPLFGQWGYKILLR